MAPSHHDPNDLDARFRRIYEATLKPTTAYLYARCQQESDLQDLLQDTFIEVLKVLAKTPDARIRNPGGLVRQLAKQQLHKFYRSRERNRWVSLQHVSGDEHADLAPSMLDQKDVYDLHHPEDAVMRQILVDQIKETIREESFEDRRILLMHYELDMTFKDIAHALQCPLSTVKSRYYRFIRKIKRNFEEGAP